ncbi:hypothetical protein H2201_002853 [Coniosporium apollinis]|uniref:FAS1 domain-containing protein n=2 Tax=Coniosporium TaxID=2810619 RepID=A0ABQ9NXA8_9PEZI|nr:hypothetical protein H2199_006524 [Cladosporium sp. JES 115]KAJ9667020.1 hypothetical protein H2201_002853 [Coniosporium apollinis]
MRHLFSKCLPLLALVPSVASQTLGSFQEVLGGNENLTSFASFLQNYTDIYGALSWSRDFTLLAPSNDAMDRIPYTSLSTVFDSADRDAIGAVLQYHVLSAIRRTEEVSSNLQFFPTWLTNATYANVTNGQRIGLVQQAGDVLIAVSGGGARSTVTSRNIQASNCMIHVIDNLLIPPLPFTASAVQFNLTAIAGAFEAADPTDYVSTASDVTIFAPNNEAMQAIGGTLQNLSSTELASLTNYHVVNNSVLYSSAFGNGTTLTSRSGQQLTVRVGGNRLFVNSAQVIQQDLLIANGVIHVLDNVLSPNASAAAPNLEVGTQAPVVQGSAVADVPFTTFLPCTTCTTETSSSATATTTMRTTSSTAQGASASRTGAAEIRRPNGLSGALGLMAVAAALV